MPESDRYDTNLDDKAIKLLLKEARTQHQDIITRLRVRRQLMGRSAAKLIHNLTGTYLPAPFDQSNLVLRVAIGEVAKAGQHYASRISTNKPDIAVIPMTTKGDITATVDKTAGEQERADTQMWEENGGRALQWDMGMHMATGGAGYYLTLPRDAGFGLPDRQYYDTSSDEEIELLKRDGKITLSKVTHPKSGELIYAEHGDVWASRRKAAAQYRAVSGRSLFTLETFPRDQVLVGRDRDGIKWAAVYEEIPGSDGAPGTEMARSYARTKGVPEDDVGLYGIWRDRNGRIVGGIEKGGPPEGMNRPTTFTMIRFFNRVEQCIFISGSQDAESAEMVYRGKHGCRKQGEAACPVVEVPMMRTGVNTPGEEFTTPMEPVFAYAPIINQLLTIYSNIAAFNGIPRWWIQTEDGSPMRGEDGEPKVVDQEFVPGNDPAQAVAIQGKLQQLLIDASTLQEHLTGLWERLEACMPAPVSTGVSGSSAAAWQVRQLIQQAQESLRQPVDNHAAAVKEIIQMWHAWMRDLDIPVYFFPAAGHRRDKRDIRALIEFDPKDLTDSITVTQELDAPEDATVRMQVGMEQIASGLITYHEYFEEYARKQDARQAEIDMWAEKVAVQVINGQVAPPGSLIDMIAKGMQGEIHYMLIEESDNYAISVAEQMAQQAQAPMPGQGGGNVAQAAGVSEPGMGMATSLQGQLGNVPGGQAPSSPVIAGT
jgi:hypothetical protein